MPSGKWVSNAEIFFREAGGRQVYVGDAHGVSVNETSNDKPVMTFEEGGIAGFTDGPGSAEVTFDSAKPRRGQRKNFRKIMRAKQDVTLVIEDGERTQYEGRIMSVNATYSLENPANLQCRVMCKAGKLLKDD